MTGYGERAGGGAGRERVSRPHVWPCQHCGMVEDHRLTRQAQLQLAEGAYRQDEHYPIINFKQWLQSYQWETAPDETAPTEDGPPDERPAGGDGDDANADARCAVASLSLLRGGAASYPAAEVAAPWRRADAGDEHAGSSAADDWVDDARAAG